jgi:uncharacterized repeat protein (TIGR01451 family)
VVNVTEVNTAPVLAAIPNQSITETLELTFSVQATDGDVPVQTLSYGLGSDAPAGATIDNDGLVSWTPAESDGGNVINFTVLVTDTGNLSDSQPVQVTVTKVNAAPVITAGNTVSVTMTEDSTPTPFGLTLYATDIDLPPDTLTWSLSSGPANGVALASGIGLSRTVTYTPTADFNGFDSFTVAVSDGTLTDTIEVSVTVTAVNDPPSFVSLGDQTTAPLTDTQQVVSGWAHSFDFGPADENAAQSLQNFLVQVTNGIHLFSRLPSVSNDGTLTYTPNGAFGTADVTVWLQDDGGIDNGGINLSDPVSLTITIPGETQYSVIASTDVISETDSGSQPISFTVSRSGDTGMADQVDYNLNGTASYGSDYGNIGGSSGATGLSGTLSFGEGEVSQTITLDVFGDLVDESVTTGNLLAGGLIIDYETIDLRLFTGLTTRVAGVVVQDDDTAGVTIVESSGSSSVAEAGPSSDTYTLQLTSLPTEPVAITVAPDSQLDAGSGAGQPITLTFATDLTAFDPQTITITAVDDQLVEGAHTGLITHVVSSGDLNYTGTTSITPNPVLMVAIDDNDDVDVRLMKEVTPTTALPGQTITYTLTFSNAGSDPAYGVEISDAIPPEVGHVSEVTTSGVAITQTPGLTYAWTVGDLAPGQGGVITIHGEVNVAAGSFTNVATITTTSVESDTLNNSDQASVTVSNAAPVLALLSDQVITETETLTFTATATDTDQTLTYSLSDAPAEASIDDNSGQFTWTTTEADGPGVYSATIVVSDGVLTDSQTIEITVTEVNEAPVLTTIPDQTALQGETISFTATATDTDVPTQTLTFSLSDAPVDATIDSTGVFTWLTTEAGVYNATVIVSDGLLTDSQTIEITLNDDNTAPVLDPIAPQAIIETQTLTFTAMATDAEDDPLTYGLYNASSGMSIDPDSGEFSWTPTEAQGMGAAYFFSIIVSDTGGLTDTTVVMITVNELNEAPVLAAIGDQTLPETQLFTLTLEATDSDLPANSLSYSMINAPAGASLAETSGLFSWTPDANQGPGEYTVTFIVSDDGSPVLTDSETITLSVNDSPGVVITESGGSTEVDEDGTLTAGYHVVLNTQPGEDVTITITPDGQVETSETSLTFTPANWDEAQTVLVNAVDDTVYEGAHTGQITHAVSSLDPTYDGLSIAGVSAHITDNDPLPSLDIGAVTVDEAAGTAMVAVTLTGQSILPAGVSYTISDGTASGSGVDYSASDGTLTWAANTPGSQTIEVTIIDDTLDESDETIHLSLSNAVSATISTGSGLVTITDNDATVPSTEPVIYVSSESNGRINGLSFADEDILAYDPNTGAWSKYFDGSDVGLNGADLVAFSLLDDGSILVSLDRRTSLPGLGRVEDTDIVRFSPTALGENTSGNFEWYFDGSDVGLTWATEDVDTIAFTPEGDLVISTIGPFTVPGIGGRDEDLIRFKATSLGQTTRGAWEWYFDGSDIGLRRFSEDIRSAWIDPANSDIYLTTRGNFAVDEFNGDGADIFICHPQSLGASTSCTFSFYWDGSAHGFAGESIDAFAIALNETEANSAPELTALSDQTVDEGETVSFMATATDSDTPAQTLTYSLSDAPAGASIGSSGEFTWTTTEADGPGVYSATIVVSDGILTDSQTIEITVNEVNEAPVLVTIPDKSILQGETVSFTATATDSDVPTQTLTYSLGDAPAAASIDSSSGAFTWTTAESDTLGVYSATVIVSDGVLTDSQSVQITLTDGNTAPVLDPIAPQAITETQTLTFTTVATDAEDDPLTFGLYNASSGMSIDPNSGEFSWTPTEAQGMGAAYFFSIIISDTGGLTDTTVVMITVNEVNAVPVLAALGDQALAETHLFTMTVSATDSDLPANSLSYTMLNAPAGTSLDETSGLFSWTPDVNQGPGEYSVTFIVSDDGSPVLTDSETITLSVTDAPGVVITESGGSTEVDEDGTITSGYHVVLNTQPSEDVIITITKDSQVETSETSLTFTPDNWAEAQSVLVSAVDDAVYEGPHTGQITHTVSSLDPNYDGFSIAGVVANISDNDPLPSLDIGTVTVDEAVGTATVAVTLTGQSIFPAGVSYTITAGTADGNGVDYNAADGTLTWAANTPGNQTIEVTIIDDTLDEPDETINLSLSNAVSATINTGSSLLTISDNDEASALSITKSVDQTNDPVQPGDVITYTIVVTNSGSDAFGVVISDSLPAYINGPDLNQTVDVAANDSVIFTIPATVADDVPVGLTITNTARFSHASGTGQAAAAITAVEVVPSTEPVIYVSSESDGNVNGLSFADEDILAYDPNTGTWSKFFDGSDVGLNGADLVAFSLRDDGSILLSLDRRTSLPGLGRVEDTDIVRFIPTTLGENTSGRFEWYFDGSDVGLTWPTEDIDTIAFTPEGDLVISTIGPFAVPWIAGRDEDLIRFKATSLGQITRGAWERYLDGSDIGLRRNSEDIRSAWIDPANSDIYLTTRGNFAVDGFSGDGADIFICHPQSLGASTHCTFSFYWDGSAHGLAGESIDAFTIAPQADLETMLAATGLLEAGRLSAATQDDPDQVDNPEEEDITADDAGDEDDPDAIHDLDDVSTGTDNNNSIIFLPIIVRAEPATSAQGVNPGDTGEPTATPTPASSD